MPTHTQALGVTAGGDALAYEVALTADGETNLSLTVADSVVDQQVNIVIDFSALVSFFIYSDYAITVETNDGTTPDNTLTVAAGVPIVWYTGCDHDNPFAAGDVTDADWKQAITGVAEGAHAANQAFEYVQTKS